MPLWLWITIIAAAAAAAYYFWKKHKGNSKDNAAKQKNLDAGNQWVENPRPSLTTPAPWASSFPTQSIFYIVPGVFLLGIGIHLQEPGVLTQKIDINNSQLEEVRGQLEAAVDGPISGSLFGKVFIRRGDQAADADKVVYLLDNGNGTASVNLVTIGQTGFAQGPGQPNGPSKPFFTMVNGQIMPAHLATQALASQSALLSAANYGNLSAPRSAMAVEMAGAESHQDITFASAN